MMALDKTYLSSTTLHYAYDFLFHATYDLIRRRQYNMALQIINRIRQNDQIKPILQFLLFHVAFVFLEGVIRGKLGDPKGYQTCDEIIAFYYEKANYTEYANSLKKYLTSIQTQ